MAQELNSLKKIMETNVKQKELGGRTYKSGDCGYSILVELFQLDIDDIELLQKKMVGLIEKGAHVNRVHSTYDTPLSCLVKRGLLELVVELVDKHGADVNFFNDERECSPLEWAVIDGNVEIVSFLLKSGAKPLQHKTQSLFDIIETQKGNLPRNIGKIKNYEAIYNLLIEYNIKPTKEKAAEKIKPDLPRSSANMSVGFNAKIPNDASATVEPITSSVNSISLNPTKGD